MLGAILFGLLGYWLGIAFGPRVALAATLAGAVAGVIWAAPHLDLNPAGLLPLAWGAVAVMAVVGAVLGRIVWRELRPRPEWAVEVVEYDAAEAITADPEGYAGLERHFYPDAPRAARVPGMWRGGFQLVGGLVSSDVAFAARAVARGRARWQGRRGRPAIPAPLRGSDRGRERGRRYDVGRAA